MPPDTSSATGVPFTSTPIPQIPGPDAAVPAVNDTVTGNVPVSAPVEFGDDVIVIPHVVAQYAYGVVDVDDDGPGSDGLGYVNPGAGDIDTDTSIDEPAGAVHDDTHADPSQHCNELVPDGGDDGGVVHVTVTAADEHGTAGSGAELHAGGSESHATPASATTATNVTAP